MDYNIISFLLSSFCTITGIWCTILFIRLNTQKELKTLQEITLTMVFYSVVAFVLMLKRGIAVVQSDPPLSFTIFDGLAYTFHMLGNIFLLLFTRSLFRVAHRHIDFLVQGFEGGLAILLNIFYYIGQGFAILLGIHALMSIYIYTILSMDSFRTKRALARNHEDTIYMDQSLRLIGISGAVMLISTIIFVLADLFLAASPAFSWVYSVAWSLSAIFGITVYLGYISPDLRQRQSLQGSLPPAPLFEQISYLKATVDQLREEIVNRERLEGLLRSSIEKAVDASHAKSDFLANMSHELRTPLNSIIGFSQLLLDHQIPRLEDQYEALSLICESGNHLLRLVNDILDLSKIEAGKVECQWTKVDIRALIDNVSSLFLPQIHEKTLKISVTDEGCPRTILADERKLKQIMLNIIDNAVKFSNKGGPIEIEMRQLGDEFRLVVQDHGIGIKKEELDQLFNPFAQIERVFTKKYQGTGLGLYYSKKLVELHKGQITLTSVYGQGTRIAITIPQPSGGELAF